MLFKRSRILFKECKSKTILICHKNKNTRLKSKINGFKWRFSFAFGVEAGSSCGGETPHITYSINLVSEILNRITSDSARIIANSSRWSLIVAFGCIGLVISKFEPKKVLQGCSKAKRVEIFYSKAEENTTRSLRNF